jgi:CDP-paratose 2-epimerase
MNAQRLGLVARLATEEGVPSGVSLDSELESKTRHLRLVLPALTRANIQHCVAALAAMEPRPDALVVLQPAASELYDFHHHVDTIVQSLTPGRSAVELVVMPPMASIWEVEVHHEQLAMVFDHAAKAVRRRELRLVWGLSAPISDRTLQSLERHGFVDDADVVLVDLTRSRSAAGWERIVGAIRSQWRNESVWLAAGLSEVRASRAPGELDAFVRAVDLDPPRLYWDPSADLLRLWRRASPRQAIATLAAQRHEPAARSGTTQPSGRGRVLVTGGAGFIGCNLAARLLERGHEVVVLDSFERDGAERNLEWLYGRWGSGMRFIPGDVRDASCVRRALEGVEHVFHLAGQVAVTSSLEDPVTDFEINARGTLNVLEEIRRCHTPPAIVFTSTNKVYGNLQHVALQELERRYVPADEGLRARGVDESCSLDLHSPYGCSKGTGDQYMLDYAKSYDIPAVVFRMSCIYGPRQLGTEDQGWVAHFFRRALERANLTIYGDGKQVRDILFVDDLVAAFLLAIEGIDRLRGRAFNIGGGPDNAISLLELIDWIESLHGHRPGTSFAPWRRGDQRYYVSGTARFCEATGWTPTVDIKTGLGRLHGWLSELSARGDNVGADWSLSGGALVK